MKKTYPNKSEKWILNETEKYWSPGAKTIKELVISPPPHTTGCAVDLTIRESESKQLLEMGSIFDDVNEIANFDYFEKYSLNH